MSLNNDNSDVEFQFETRTETEDDAENSVVKSQDINTQCSLTETADIREREKTDWDLNTGTISKSDSKSVKVSHSSKPSAMTSKLMLQSDEVLSSQEVQLFNSINKRFNNSDCEETKQISLHSESKNIKKNINVEFQESQKTYRHQLTESPTLPPRPTPNISNQSLFPTFGEKSTNTSENIQTSNCDKEDESITTIEVIINMID